MNKEITSIEAFRNGITAILPIALGVASYGVVYGLLTRGILTFAETIAMSSIVFAGLSQFVALEIWTHPIPVFTLIFTTFIVNLRHVLMGASLYPHAVGERKKVMLATLFFLVDESWALTMQKLMLGATRPAFMLGAGIVLYASWNLSTIIGRLAGTVMPSPETIGIDFAMTAVFLIILTGLYKGKKDILAWLVAMVVSVAASYLMPGKWYIIIGGTAGFITGYFKNGD